VDGRIEVVKWLWDLSKEINLHINIQKNNDYIFKKICEKKYITKDKKKVLNFLCSLSQRYSFSNNISNDFIINCQKLCFYYKFI
jgi:hypothetical protein